MGIYEMLQTALIQEIKKYYPVYFDNQTIPVVDQNVILKQHNYPYISIGIVDDDDNSSMTYSNLGNQIIIRVQMSGVSDDKFQAKDIGLFLRKLFFLQQPIADLSEQGIATWHKPSSVPDTNSYFGNFYQFEAGADMYFKVYAPIYDKTQTGTFDNIDLNAKRKE